MGTKRRILLTALLLAGIGLVTWCLIPPPEPRYKGHALSEWLLGYSWFSGSPSLATGGSKYTLNARSQVYANWDQSDDAIRAIGTNAIPTLLRMLCANDTKTKMAFIHLMEKQRIVGFVYTPAPSLNFAGAMGFRKLGPPGAVAIPDLIKIYHRNISSWSRSATAMALSDLAPFDIPGISEGLASPDPQVRRVLVTALARIHARPDAIVPVLTRCLHDSDADVRITAAGALASYGADARAAIPDLQQLRQDQNSEVSFAAQYALDRVTPAAGAK
jgi:HEAT repeats